MGSTRREVAYTVTAKLTDSRLYVINRIIT